MSPVKSMYYFAYGSNLSPDVISMLPGLHEAIGAAQLLDYRLAFTRKLSSDGSGAADIIPARGFTTWGVVYKIDDECLISLDRKEGNQKAYEREDYTVRLMGGQIMKALSYSVINKAAEEIRPQSAYFDKMIEGAIEHKLPKPYIAFLKELSLETPNGFRKGLLASPTYDRKEAKGLYIVKISKTGKKFFQRNRVAVISHKGISVIVQVIYSKKTPANFCEIDKSLRRMLGIKGGRFTYGSEIQLQETKSRFLALQVFSPRTLVLPILRPSIFDSEKQICVLHEKHIHLLGIEEGDYLTIRAAIKKGNRAIEIRSLSRRVFTGTIANIRREGKKIEYPKLQEFYLDLDGRLELGLERDKEGVPVLISPDLSRLFGKRVLYYGVALFLSFFALSDPIKELVGLINYPPIVGTIISLLLAIIFTIILTIFDMRSKIQY